MHVADASAIVDYLLARSSLALLRALHSAPYDLHVPHLCDVEITHALRKQIVLGLAPEHATRALEHLAKLPFVRHPQLRLLPRVLSLRHNFSAYDATYIPLAETLGASLITADAKLANAARAHTAVFVLAD